MFVTALTVSFFLNWKQSDSPEPRSNPETLLRRAHFDLIGLPPGAIEIKDGVSLIDNLLSSPHYGERWARQWLEVARYAESHGLEQDYDRPHAYHFRDFVIQAFNQDMPFDQFAQWQVAGDELAPDNHLALMATGFLGAGVFPTQLTEKEFESARYDELDDMANTTEWRLSGPVLAVLVAMTISSTQSLQRSITILYPPLDSLSEVRSTYPSPILTTILNLRNGRTRCYVFKRTLRNLRRMNFLLDSVIGQKVLPETVLGNRTGLPSVMQNPNP